MASLIQSFKDFKSNYRLKQHDRRYKRWLRSYGEQLPKASKPKMILPYLAWEDKYYATSEDSSEVELSKLSFDN